jgi:hypothetical protein
MVCTDGVKGSLREGERYLTGQHLNSAQHIDIIRRLIELLRRRNHSICSAILWGGLKLARHDIELWI